MSSTFIKICGLTNLADAHVAVDAGADLLGFNFYTESPRYVPPDTAAAIVRALREDRKIEGQGDKRSGRVVDTGERRNAPLPKVVGIFVNATVAEIATIVDTVELDYVQLHGNESPDWFGPLAGRAFKAVRPANAAVAQAQAAQFAPLGCPAGPCLLIDAYDPNAYGGTGKQADWHVAAVLAHQYPGLLLAGGLSADNVAAAIDLVRPWGVDVGSGVEAEPGRKDHAKVRQFVAAVRSVLHRA